MTGNNNDDVTTPGLRLSRRSHSYLLFPDQRISELAVLSKKKVKNYHNTATERGSFLPQLGNNVATNNSNTSNAKTLNVAPNVELVAGASSEFGPGGPHGKKKNA